MFAHDSHDKIHKKIVHIDLIIDLRQSVKMYFSLEVLNINKTNTYDLFLL